MEPIEELKNVTEEQWAEAERFWISYLRFLGCPLTNLDSGGEGGKTWSEDSRKRASEQRKGKKAHPNQMSGITGYWKGRKHLPETLAKMRGRIRTKEHQEKISKSQRGRKWSEELRRKMMAVRNTPEYGAALSARAKERFRNGGMPHLAQFTGWRKGKPLSDSHREAARAGLIGKPKTPQHRAALSAAKKKWYAERKLQNAI